jgi:Ni/Co efflux regulator RcnB
MTKLLVAAALAALIATPASAQSMKGDGSDTALRSYASDTSKAKAKKKNKTVTTYHQRVSPSGNPEWDVYVRGEYVGSDPDPRVRYTLRQEATRNYGMH